MESNIKIVSCTGPKVGEFIPAIAKLRIEVFAEYPFLYEGDYEDEKKYLQKYMTMKDAIVVACFDGEELVGISTGYPFFYEAENLKRIFVENGRNPEDYFCFGESVLRKSYRGMGIGKRFFEEREAHVEKLKRYPHVCFFTFLRAVNDPGCPSDYRPLNAFWESRGFVEHRELIGTTSYQRIGETEKSPKEMVFWIK